MGNSAYFCGGLQGELQCDFDSGAHAEFPQHALRVMPRCVRADEERARDLRIGSAVGEKDRDTRFRRRQTERLLGTARDGFSRHGFVGGNFFMLRMLNRYRDELGVEALPGDLEAAAVRALDHLATSTAEVAFESVRRSGNRIVAVIDVRNLAGHKLPTAYPSRRAWLRVTVLDAAGRAVFESGALRPDGSIPGNDNDVDPARYKPHYQEISSPDQVQIYESVMGDVNGQVTTGLLSGVTYLKDNRLLPRGFDKAAADPDIAVYGAAADDADFEESSDRVHYRIDVGGATGPLRVEADLWYQPIGFRWAENLKRYDAMETNRFVRYYGSMSSASAARLARAEATVN